MDALSSYALSADIQGCKFVTPAQTCFETREIHLAKIQSCLSRIPGSGPSSPTTHTFEKLKLTSPAQIIQLFQQIWSASGQTDAVDYITSFQKLFKGYVQFQCAYYQIARDCLQKDQVAEAINIVEDRAKPSLLDELFKAACLPANPISPEKIGHLVAFARSFKDERWKDCYLLKCAAHLIHHGCFTEAVALLQESRKSFESRFSDLFFICPDRHFLYVLANSLQNIELRKRCLELYRNFASTNADPVEDPSIYFLNVMGKRTRNEPHLEMKIARTQ